MVIEATLTFSLGNNCGFLWAEIAYIVSVLICVVIETFLSFRAIWFWNGRKPMKHITPLSSVYSILLVLPLIFFLCLFPLPQSSLPMLHLAGLPIPTLTPFHPLSSSCQRGLIEFTSNHAAFHSPISHPLIEGLEMKIKTSQVIHGLIPGLSLVFSPVYITYTSSACVCVPVSLGVF